jgi:ubiquinone/menaquinone biosynthesis C-methylase UbiE
VSIGGRQVSQVRLVGVDLVPSKAASALKETPLAQPARQRRAGDAVRLPFRDASFDATFCVAVLQYVADVSDAIKEIARVTAPGGRVVIVEPDNAARYFFSSVPSGGLALQAASRFFAALAEARDDVTHPAVGRACRACSTPAASNRGCARVSRVAGAARRAAGRRVDAAARAGRGGDGGARPRRVSQAGTAFLAALDTYRRDACWRARRSSKSRTRCCLPPLARKPPPLPRAADAAPSGELAAEGHEGWDEYAPFYDWENARTLGRRDVPFWRTVARNVGGTLLELGAGTGRISIPLARAGVPVVGIDRSEPMLARARQRVKRAKLSAASASCAATSGSCPSRDASRWCSRPTACCSRCCASAICRRRSRRSTAC